MPKQVTLNVNGVLTGIRIAAGDVSTPPRLTLEGVQQDVATGQTVAAFSEDVTDLLTPAEKGRLTAIVTRAQAWIDAK